MPSSPTAAVPVPVAAEGGVPSLPAGLLAVLAAVPDPRARRGVRHRAVAVLAVSVAAVLAGARACTVIAEWAADQSADVLAALGVSGRVPSEATIRRVLSAVDAAALAAAVGAYLWTRTTVTGGRRVIAIDGKSLRGAAGPDGVMPHLVAALDHATGTVLGQLATVAKSNEIPTVRMLLKALNLTGAVVSIDAMHTQDDTAQLILDGGGDYALTVEHAAHCSCCLSWRVKESSLAVFDLDTEAFAASLGEVDGVEFAALDLVQHGLAGDAEAGGGLVEW